MEVSGDMAFDLRVTSTKRYQHAEREQFARGHINPRTRKVITEAVRGKESLNMLLIVRRRCIQLLDHTVADDLLLHCKTLFGAIFRRGGSLARKQKLDSVFLQDFIGCQEEVEHFSHSD